MNTKYTLLVVEDERSLLHVIKKKLELSGFNVVSKREVGHALEYIKDIGNVDAIWLDHYLLGDENGIDFVVELKKKNSLLQKIPIFVVSNTASPDKVSTYLELGVSKYYTKSNHRLDDIISDIRSAIELQKQQNS